MKYMPPEGSGFAPGTRKRKGPSRIERSASIPRKGAQAGPQEDPSAGGVENKVARLGMETQLEG
jgi:hypothetical protein